ncbi:MAG: flippase-like domain-containing protein [Deltaproteobacteria bacterium]|nr:flippase-like domain-containing protein [Deltaproteobacteria bacterium]
MASSPPSDARQLIHRFRGWFAGAIAFTALVFVGVSAWAGFAEVGDALVAFQWRWFWVAVLLTLANYWLRFLKWHWLVLRLGAQISMRDNLLVFISGLAMVISPAKAGEILKPYLVRERTGVPMVTTIPALVAERLTDGFATLIIAAVSVSRFAADQAALVYGTIGACALGVALLMHEGLSLAILGALSRLPLVSRVGHKLEEMYRALRACLRPWPLLVTLVVSIAAWFAECWGYQLVWLGFDRQVGLEVSSFIYAFSTVLGGAAPGGLFLADGALVALPETLLGLPEGEIVAAALLIRSATLWTGVIMGAVALFFVGRLLRRDDQMQG